MAPCWPRTQTSRAALLVLSIMLITALHYYTAQGKTISHDVYRRLHYIPIVVGAFLFGLKGSLITSGGVTLLYVPYVVVEWANSPAKRLDVLLELVLFNTMAYVTGWLVDRERAGRRQALEHERLASFGQMAASLVHEIKNPLVSIGGFAGLLGRSQNMDADDRDALQVIVEEVDRLEALLGEAMDLARPGVQCIERVDLDSLLERCMGLCGEHCQGARIELRRSLSEPLPPVRGDPGKLQQVFLNLMLNAVAAMPQGGALHLRGGAHGDAVHVEIADTGEGIPADRLEDIFVPFFTTKPGGSGLGLAVCRRIVMDHGGRMIVRSEVDVGTTFRVELPRYQRGTKG